MATVATFSVASEAFPLGATFGRVPQAHVELEPVVPTGDSVLPYFWVSGVTPEDVIAALSDRPEIESVDCIDEVEGRSLFRARWREAVESLVTAIARADVTVLSAFGNEGEWTFELRAERPEEIAAFPEYCREHGFDLTLCSVHDLAGSGTESEYGLTSEQREALLLAYRAGYYEEPRAVTLADLAAEIGITRQSLSSRLRRGYRNLLASTIGGATDE